MGSFSIFSFAVKGVEGLLVHVEASITSGLPNFTIVGLPDTAVQESRERVRAAIVNSGFTFPRSRITVNLAPGEIKKHGPMYDLPIALAVLVASEQLSQKAVRGLLIAGELSLSGDIIEANDWVIGFDVSTQKGLKAVCRTRGQKDAGSAFLLPANLRKLVEEVHAGTLNVLPRVQVEANNNATGNLGCDPFASIVGQEFAKRALVVAASGNHSLLLIGPPGSGKTLLAHALPQLLPKPTEKELQEIRRIYSIMRIPPPQARPLRAPHHTTTATALIGGGVRPAPGEITLAHNGVLLLDELPEFKRYTIECLRGPIESGSVTISRQRDRITYPANFQLIATMNPCPCGFAYFEPERCTCNPDAILRYQKRISGPLLDRFNLVIEVPRVPSKDLLANKSKPEPSSNPHKHIHRAHMARHTIEKQAPSQEALALLNKAFTTFQLSMRSYNTILSVAATIAALNNAPNIGTKEISEALQYRPRLFNSRS